jgi:hypothetical protein
MLENLSECTLTALTRKYYHATPSTVKPSMAAWYSEQQM